MRTVVGDLGKVLRAEAACPLSVTVECGKRTLHVTPQLLTSSPSGGKLLGPVLALLCSGSEPGPSVLPQAARRKGCLKLWRGCTEPGGVLACPATTLLNQLKKTLLYRVRGKYPGQLETGNSRSSLSPTRLPLAPLASGFSDVTVGLAAPECLHGIKHDMTADTSFCWGEGGT